MWLCLFFSFYILNCALQWSFMEITKVEVFIFCVCTWSLQTSLFSPLTNIQDLPSFMSGYIIHPQHLLHSYIFCHFITWKETTMKWNYPQCASTLSAWSQEYVLDNRLVNGRVQNCLLCRMIMEWLLVWWIILWWWYNAYMVKTKLKQVKKYRMRN